MRLPDHQASRICGRVEADEQKALGRAKTSRPDASPTLMPRPPAAGLEINRAPVLILWAAVVAERLGHPADTALTLGRAVAGSAARVKARNIGREERKADRDADRPGRAVAVGSP